MQRSSRILAGLAAVCCSLSGYCAKSAVLTEPELSTLSAEQYGLEKNLSELKTENEKYEQRLTKLESDRLSAESSFHECESASFGPLQGRLQALVSEMEANRAKIEQARGTFVYVRDSLEATRRNLEASRNATERSFRARARDHRYSELMKAYINGIKSMYIEKFRNAYFPSLGAYLNAMDSYVAIFTIYSTACQTMKDKRASNLKDSTSPATPTEGIGSLFASLFDGANEFFNKTDSVRVNISCCRQRLIGKLCPP
jgi:chromosome segregation ATPase